MLKLTLVGEMGEANVDELLFGDVAVCVDIGGLKIRQHRLILEMHTECLHRLHETAHVDDALALGVGRVEGSQCTLLHALCR